MTDLSVSSSGNAEKEAGGLAREFFARGTDFRVEPLFTGLLLKV